MELIVEAVISDGFPDEDAVGQFLDQVDLTGSHAELFFAENDEHSVTCVFQVKARNIQKAVYRTAAVMQDGLRRVEREDLIPAVKYAVRPPAVYEETHTNAISTAAKTGSILLATIWAGACPLILGGYRVTVGTLA